MNKINNRMYNSFEHNNQNKYIPQDRSNLEYYDIKKFLPGNQKIDNVDRNQKNQPKGNINYSPKQNPLWNEGKPNFDHINYSNTIKKERKGQILY